MKNALELLTGSVLTPLGLTESHSATDAAIHKKVFGSGARTSNLVSSVTTLIISNKEVDDIIKIVKSLEKFGLLINGVSETAKKKQKNKNTGFLRMLLLLVY